MTNRFTHSGDLGDIIYALPAIRAAGGGVLCLTDIPRKTRHGLSPERAARIMPLLKLQPYLDDVVYEPDAPEHPLNFFRGHPTAGNLSDQHLHCLGMRWIERAERWLTIDYADETYSVIFSRSPRHHNPRFPWRRVVNAYRDHAAFVGFREEYEDFCRRFGAVPYAPANDLLEVARLIAGCRLFVGNQSCPAAISEGLKQTMILEVCPKYTTACVFQRINCLLGHDERLELPSLKLLMQLQPANNGYSVSAAAGDD